jgi:hypothetical protein
MKKKPTTYDVRNPCPVLSCVLTVTMLLDYQFLIAPWVFPNVYLTKGKKKKTTI